MRGGAIEHVRACASEQVMYTCDMEAAGPFSIKIDSFDGRKQDLTTGFSPEHAEQLLANLFVEAQLMEGDVPIGLPSRTVYSCYGGDFSNLHGHGRALTNQCRWGDLLTFSHIRYWHLPRTAEMHLTLRALCAPRKMVTLGHCSFSLFSKKGRLKSGRKKVVVELYSKIDNDSSQDDADSTVSSSHGDETAADDATRSKPKRTVPPVGARRAPPCLFQRMCLICP